jgi:hypothetical protein
MPGVEPVFLVKDQALDYAKKRDPVFAIANNFDRGRSSDIVADFLKSPPPKAPRPRVRRKKRQPFSVALANPK